MPEIFWKSIIEHLVSWPVSALILGWMFRAPLTDLVKRINSIKAPGIDLSAPPLLASAAQLEPKIIETSEALKGEIVAPEPSKERAIVTAKIDVSAELVSRRQAVKDYGKKSALVVDTIRSIKADLDQLRFPLDSAETGEILVRQLAVTQSMLRHERTHRLIFGSQIVALHLLANAGNQPDAALSPIFEGARDREPNFYGTYSFEDWLGFLFKEIAILKVKPDKIGITVYGRSYLEYIGVFASSPKPH